ncbi:MAG: bifunctional diaminohydroxyphosphoribosylaminopyrimidine deaminase/5-amino-6-(5-phosphoribosylamino)uracil reductase RibD [Angustibacter sp.]
MDAVDDIQAGIGQNRNHIATDAAVHAAMRQALRLARRGPVGRNPQVGCVVLDVEGRVLGTGHHAGAGTAHAEVVALAAAGLAARGGTAVVTLEPCCHTGRTGPCTAALLAAGVARVVYGRPDRTPQARGGAHLLREAGVDAHLISDPRLRHDADELVRHWQQAEDLGRPMVTWKFATSLDGRSAARDGSSRWITSEAARHDVHDLRAECDTILVGTGTALADDPRLSVRDRAGIDRPYQPWRVVVGMRSLPSDHQLARSGVSQLRTHDPVQVVNTVWERGHRHVWLEGGPRLAAAFWRAGLVDRVVVYVAPVLLGAGPNAVADLDIDTITDAARLTVVDARRVGADVRLILEPEREAH